jgi:hypothetical protein
MLADTRAHKPQHGPVTRPLSVRLAQPGDEPAILNLLLEDLAENATQVAPPSIERLQQQIEVGTRNKGGFLPVVDDAMGVCAVALIVPAPWWFSETLFLQEVFLYVAPRARGTRAFSDLLTYEKWLSWQMTLETGRTMHVLAGVTAPHRRDGKVRAYGRHMQQIGSFFIFPSIEGLQL